MSGSERLSGAPYVERAHPGGRAPILLLCDHAGREVPPELDGLGLRDVDLAGHIGWDIGAAEVTRRLARLLDAPALLDHCSRLVIDPNRRPRTATSIPAVSDGSIVPGNAGVAPGEVDRRIRRYFLPYHRAIARQVAAFRRAGRLPAIIAVHSFTPRMNGQDRPWQIGILWRADQRLARGALEALRARADLTVGDNQPYSGLDEFGFTIEFHGQRSRLPHLMIELRQDEIATSAGADRYATVIADVLRRPLASPGLHRPFEGPLTEGQPWRAPKGLMALR